MNSDSSPTGSVHHDNRGRVVLVTGGCSGIRLAICQAFAASGASVVALDIAPQRPPEMPASVEIKHADTSIDDDCRRGVEEVWARHGRMDVLVNNAAIQPPESYRPVDEYLSELWERLLAVNFTGYTNMARHVIPLMKKQGGGVIINMASGQGHRTTRGVPAYGPIKAANIMQARQWGVEYARHGIRVVSVSPGAIDTPLVRATLEAQGGAADLANRHPLGRIGRPEEVARAVMWLASQDASFITATDLEVDGGLGAFGAFADPYPRDP